ncbi:MAG: P-type conjugative transfer protein TrbG [Acidobacteriota bacterium]|nr:P-type conjugative transfer protein TrbG [Acidobacteriota bacterium]
MIWTAAILLAFQAAAGVPSSPQGVTPQQKQALSQYNFKSASAALNAQSNQAVHSQIPLVSIPPLEVPPITNRIPTAQPSGAGGSRRTESAVPAGWKPPHTELGPTGASAVAIARDLDFGVSTPTPGPDGRVMYVFGQGTPVMVCAPLRVCAVELQPGERLQSQPQIGDSRRWEITPVISGSGLNQAPILILKPIEPGLETDLIVPTDRRTYVVRLISDQTRFISRLAFQYPGDERAKWTAFEAQQDAAKRNAEALIEQQRIKDKHAGVLPMADGALDNLYFDYKIDGDPAYRPERVLDDGVHTYLIYPNDGRFREVPTLLLVVNGKTELVNFRVDGSRYIVDRLFDKAVLVVGVGKKQRRVTITRAKPYSGSTGKRS